MGQRRRALSEELYDASVELSSRKPLLVWSTPRTRSLHGRPLRVALVRESRTGPEWLAGEAGVGAVASARRPAVHYLAGHRRVGSTTLGRPAGGPTSVAVGANASVALSMKKPFTGGSLDATVATPCLSSHVSAAVRVARVPSGPSLSGFFIGSSSCLGPRQCTDGCRVAGGPRYVAGEVESSAAEGAPATAGCRASLPVSPAACFHRGERRRDIDFSVQLLLDQSVALSTNFEPLLARPFTANRRGS